MSVLEITRLDWVKHRLVDNRIRKFGLPLIDVAAILLAVCLAFLLYYRGQFAHQHQFEFWAILVMALLAKMPIFVLMGMYRVRLTNFGLADMTEVFKAVSIGSILLVGMSVLSWGIQRVDLPIIVTDYLFTLVLIGGLRASKRVYSQVLRQHRSISVRRALIVGAGSACELTLRTIFQEMNPECLPVGIIDDDPAKRGMTIHGIPVLGKRQDIPHLVQTLRVQELLVTMPSAQPSVLREIAQIGRKAGLQRIRVLPAIHKMISGKVAISDLRDLQVEDLLGREPVQIDTELIENYVRDKVVLVTGGAGSIGSELCRRITAFHPELLVVLDQDETALFYLKQELNLRSSSLKLSVVVGDIQDEDRIRNVFAYFRPKVVFHSAAYKHVSMMEENPEEAVKNNVMGTKIVGEAACLYGAEDFVFISTDKAVNPTCIMGATKRLAELVVQSLNEHNSCRFMSVRFGNVLGSRGSVVPIFREQIQHGGPVTVTHPDMRRYFMTPSEAVLLVLQAGAIGNGGEIFVLDMGAPTAILDLAREMINLAGLEPDKDIPIVFTQPYPGEKLFEDILTAEEGTLATKHHRIHIAKTNPAASTGENLKRAFEELQVMISHGDTSVMIEKLCKLVPNYRPDERTVNHLLGTPSLTLLPGTRARSNIKALPRRVKIL
ncbi:polysaccharide biosynthesis protein [Chloroflexota bacterium]